MKSFGFVFSVYFLLMINRLIQSSCPDDDDLQQYQCQCDPMTQSIYCSSFPYQCRSCYRYKMISFDDNVTMLPVESFRLYRLFEGSSSTKSFQIQFSHLTLLSSNAFSRLNVAAHQNLQIRIFRYSSSIFSAKLFEDLTIETDGKFQMEIVNVTSSSLTFENSAFEGIKLSSRSQFRFSILHAKEAIRFASKAGSIFLPANSYVELDFSNFISLQIAEHSFDHVTQEDFSEFIVNFAHFQSARLSRNSFYDFQQLDQSRFHFSLENFRLLQIEPTAFDSITQRNSMFIVSIFDLTNDLCLPNETLRNLQQEFNATFLFEIDFVHNLLFQSNSFFDVYQTTQSTFAIRLTNSLDVYFSRHALKKFHQENQSFIDLWIRHGQNLIFEDEAIDQLDTSPSSVFRIGFQFSTGSLQMATNTFSNVHQRRAGELIFQLTNSSNFYFRFNQSISFERLQILDRSLSDVDFCRIANIPSHIPVQVRWDTPCSCSVFYLYRQLHHQWTSSKMKELTPICYANFSFDQIEQLEKKCSFEKRILHCQQMEGEIEITVPQDICFQNLQVTSKTSSNSTFFVILFLLGCLIVILICTYLFLSNHRTSFSSSSSSFNVVQQFLLPYRRQPLTVYSAADSYQQLTQIERDDNVDKTREIIVKYNSTRNQLEQRCESSLIVCH